MFARLPAIVSLFGRQILLGVCGSVAAYKACVVVRELRRRGAAVRVVMTHGAREFVAPLTFQSLSGHPVEENAFDGAGEDGMKHIELARWADMVLIAPASANVFAKLANGAADDLLTMVCLAASSRLVTAPAMNRQMWNHPAVQANVETLRRRGAVLLGPEGGEQACGDTGEGRMTEPEAIADAVEELFGKGRFAGRKLVVTAGPTHEALDPVRYFGNRSSGRMGFALAEAAASMGGEVVLLAGPVALAAPAGVRRIDVTTAAGMCAAALREARDADIFIGCAAVADYRPAQVSGSKIKRSGRALHLELVPNIDVIKTVASQNPRPFMAGFAAETGGLEAHAKAKLLEKNLDLIFANEVGAHPGVGFDGDLNEVTAYWRGGRMCFGKAPKTVLGRRLMELVADRCRGRAASTNEKKHTA